MPTVLIELPDGEGVVRRDDAEIVVSQDVSDDRGQPLRDGDHYRPVKTWLPDDRCLVGGLLPPAAVSAEVIDDRGTRLATRIGGGAYAAILEQPKRRKGLHPPWLGLGSGWASWALRGRSVSRGPRAPGRPRALRDPRVCRGLARRGIPAPREPQEWPDHWAGEPRARLRCGVAM